MHLIYLKSSAHTWKNKQEVWWILIHFEDVYAGYHRTGNYIVPIQYRRICIFIICNYTTKLETATSEVELNNITTGDTCIDVII